MVCYILGRNRTVFPAPCKRKLHVRHARYDRIKKWQSKADRDGRERSGRGTPENLIFQGAKTGLGSPQNPLDFSFRFFFSHRLIPTSLRPGRLYLNVLLDFVGRGFAPPIVVEKIPFFLAFLVMVSVMAALSVSGGSESVLALAVIAVAVLALHASVAVLLAWNKTKGSQHSDG